MKIEDIFYILSYYEPLCYSTKNFAVILPKPNVDILVLTDDEVIYT